MADNYMSASPLLGECLIEAGLITRAQLGGAIAAQAETGGRLGDIVAERGYAARADIEDVAARMAGRLPLGEMVVRSGLVAPGQLREALAFQRRSGGRLGDILLSLGMIGADDLYRQIASQQRMGRMGRRLDFTESDRLPFALARKHGAAVVARRPDRYALAVQAPLEPPALAEIEAALGLPAEQLLASPYELEGYHKAIYSRELTDESVYRLANESPENSASRTFTRPQLWTIALLLLAVAVGLVRDALRTVLAVNGLLQLLYAAMTVFRMRLLFKGASRGSQIAVSDEELAAIDERELPVYTILIPMYREKDVASKLYNNIESLDYPKAKLDIRLLLEENDPETIEAVRALDLPAYYTVLVVEDSLPKTKPKACNYGLISARGELVVIYDAEDRPEPDQLKKVYAAFRRMPEHCVCIQGKLNYFNSSQNLLTQWFTQEYSMWFELLLPGIARMNVPVPLGGTSNHFKTKYLKELGAWDPFNVTEDADLGIRLFKKGYTTAVVDSRTWEEANSRVGNWIRQRSRWIKGYMQTWLVHMRRPVSLLRELKPAGFLGFQATIFGSFLIPLLNPFLWTFLALWFATKAAWIPRLFPGPVYYCALALLVLGNFFFVYSNTVGMYVVIDETERGKSRQSFSYGMIKYSALMPLYWVLMSAASYKALWQLIFKPFHWEKTDHGLSDDRHDTVGTFGAGKEAAL